MCCITQWKLLNLINIQAYSEETLLKYNFYSNEHTSTYSVLQGQIWDRPISLSASLTHSPLMLSFSLSLFPSLTYTHTHTVLKHTCTHRPNHWIISLAHFLRHADWSNDSIWFRQCDLILLVLFGSVWIGLLMRWDQKHTTGSGRA